MSELLALFQGFPTDAVGGFALRVLDAILVGAVVAWLLSLGRLRDRRAVRMQIAEQLCRVFGMRLYNSAKSRKLIIEELPHSSLQGWDSLDRLQWSLDLNRALLSAADLRVLQAVIEDLLRVRANQWTAELHLFDKYLPAAAKRFLPPPLRAPFLDIAKYTGWDRLITPA